MCSFLVCTLCVCVFGCCSTYLNSIMKILICIQRSAQNLISYDRYKNIYR